MGKYWCSGVKHLNYTTQLIDELRCCVTTLVLMIFTLFISLNYLLQIGHSHVVDSSSKEENCSLAR